MTQFIMNVYKSIKFKYEVTGIIIIITKNRYI